MNLRNCKDYHSRHHEDGFTLIELLVAMTIMSILGVSMWLGFTAAIKLIHTIPESTRLIQEFIALDAMLREHVGRVTVPFWEPELDYYIDSAGAQFPFYEGIKTKFLLIEYYDNEILLKTFEEDGEEDPKIIFRTGPFTYVSFTEIEEKELGLLGLELTVKPEHENIDEFSIFARFGAYPFEKP